MDVQIIFWCLAFLSIGLTLNLKLTIAVLHRSRVEREDPVILQPGEVVPPLTARLFASRERVNLTGNKQASVLLFLASQCPKCASKLPELEKLAVTAEPAGLRIWFVSEEPKWRIRRFLENSNLLSRVARLSREDYVRLNASLASPSYHFVSAEGILEATGFIGDEDWQSLNVQLGLAANEI